MPIAIDGTGSITGLSAGGLPNGSVTPDDLSQKLTLDTAKTATSTFVDFTGIPSWVKRVTVMFSGVSTNGTSRVLVQLGTSSGATVSGYTCTSTILNSTTQTSANSTAGFVVDGLSATDARSAIATVLNISGNGWVCAVHGKCSSDTTITSGGDVTLSGTLDRIRITTVNGTDTFDAGTINILYE